MVEIVHDVGGASRSEESAGQGGGMFLLSDRAGTFLSLSPGEPVTKYNGLVGYDSAAQAFFKTLEGLHVPGEVVAVRRHADGVERVRSSGAVERWALHGSCLSLDLRGCQGELALELDIRRLDDEPREGRRYTVVDHRDTLVIHHEQFTDGSMTQRSHEYFLVIKGIPESGWRPCATWQERRYAYDERRGDSAVLWTYLAGTIRSDRKLFLQFGSGETLDKALQAITRHGQAVLMSGNDDAAMALDALDALTVTLPGKPAAILAGYPWFREPWSRDELISLGAHIAAGRYDFCSGVLERYYALLEREDRLFAHYPAGGLIAADALGWVAKRTEDLLTALTADGLDYEYFPHERLERIAHRLGRALQCQPTDENGFILNGPGETWMDAPVRGDTRAGARLEIQALQLCGLRLQATLERRLRHDPVHAQRWERRAHAFAVKVREHFLVDGMLVDGIQEGRLDRTPRPNVFLVCYLVPELLPADDWARIFDRLLERLALPWGGLASIDTKHPLFVARYAGMRNASYHRGDSWYWIDALAALCLHRVDPVHFHDAVERLRACCVRDMFSHGCVGHCSEVSSAAEQEWGGCFAQAWSAAMLYELLAELS